MVQEIPARASTPENASLDFARDGYVLLPGVLGAQECARLRSLIDAHAARNLHPRHAKENRHVMFKHFFEEHPSEALDVFMQPVVRSVCDGLIKSCGSGRRNDSCLKMHVIHNHAFRVDPGGRGQAAMWHTDDAPKFTTRDGGPLPDTVALAPMTVTCMYFLNDLRGPQDGGTRVIPGSHRFGRPCSQEAAEKQPTCVYARAPEGSVLILSADVWHRGAPVRADGRPRYVFQVTYARRLVGHKHRSIMNYVLPPAVMTAIGDDPEKREMMGFLQGGAYS